MRMRREQPTLPRQPLLKFFLLNLSVRRTLPAVVNAG